MTTDSKNYISLRGKVAVITGAGNGIGRGIAHRIAQAGADVYVADVDTAAAATVTGELREFGVRSEDGFVDVTKQESTDEMVSAAITQMGRVDILVNNAGVGGAPGWADRAVGSIDDWNAVFEVNVLGIVHASQSVSQHMIDRGTGKIVNIASIAGRRGSPGFAHYSASKASAINITQAFAYKLAPHKINVNSVCPGILWTSMWESIAARNLKMSGDSETSVREYFEQRFGTVPLGREQTPEDVGNAVAFLASDRARNITGQALNVDGGMRMN